MSFAPKRGFCSQRDFGLQHDRGHLYWQAFEIVWWLGGLSESQLLTSSP